MSRFTGNTSRVESYLGSQARMQAGHGEPVDELAIINQNILEVLPERQHLIIPSTGYTGVPYNTLSLENARREIQMHVVQNLGEAIHQNLALEVLAPVIKIVPSANASVIRLKLIEASDDYQAQPTAEGAPAILATVKESERVCVLSCWALGVEVNDQMLRSPEGPNIIRMLLQSNILKMRELMLYMMLEVLMTSKTVAATKAMTDSPDSPIEQQFNYLNLKQAYRFFVNRGDTDLSNFISVAATAGNLHGKGDDIKYVIMNASMRAAERHTNPRVRKDVRESAFLTGKGAPAGSKRDHDMLTYDTIGSLKVIPLQDDINPNAGNLKGNPTITTETMSTFAHFGWYPDNNYSRHVTREVGSAQLTVHSSGNYKTIYRDEMFKMCGLFNFDHDVLPRGDGLDDLLNPKSNLWNVDKLEGVHTSASIRGVSISSLKKAMVNIWSRSQNPKRFPVVAGEFKESENLVRRLFNYICNLKPEHAVKIYASFFTRSLSQDKIETVVKFVQACNDPAKESGEMKDWSVEIRTFVDDMRQRASMCCVDEGKIGYYILAALFPVNLRRLNEINLLSSVPVAFGAWRSLMQFSARALILSGPDQAQLYTSDPHLSQEHSPLAAIQSRKAEVFLNGMILGDKVLHARGVHATAIRGGCGSRIGNIETEFGDYETYGYNPTRPSIFILAYPTSQCIDGVVMINPEPFTGEYEILKERWGIDDTHNSLGIMSQFYNELCNRELWSREVSFVPVKTISSDRPDAHGNVDVPIISEEAHCRCYNPRDEDYTIVRHNRGSLRVCDTPDGAPYLRGSIVCK